MSRTVWWQVGLVSNAIVSIAYVLIGYAVLRPLVNSAQLRTNLLGAATGAIFFSCAVHRALLVVFLVVPYLDGRSRHGAALRAAYAWQMAIWNLVTAALGIYYWTLRHTYSSVIKGATLFADIRQRERDALQLNDTVLQGLVVAKLAFELDDHKRGLEALDTSSTAVGGLVGELLALNKTRALGLLRSEAISLRDSS